MDKPIRLNTFWSSSLLISTALQRKWRQKLWSQLKFKEASQKSNGVANRPLLLWSKWQFQLCQCISWQILWSKWFWWCLCRNHSEYQSKLMGKGTSAIVYFHEEKNKPQTTQGFNPQMANTYLNCEFFRGGVCPYTPRLGVLWGFWKSVEVLVTKDWGVNSFSKRSWDL